MSNDNSVICCTNKKNAQINCDRPTAEFKKTNSTDKQLKTETNS